MQHTANLTHWMYIMIKTAYDEAGDAESRQWYEPVINDIANLTQFAREILECDVGGTLLDAILNSIDFQVLQQLLKT